MDLAPHAPDRAPGRAVASVQVGTEVGIEVGIEVGTEVGIDVGADFESFVLCHGPELVRFARRLTLDHHRAEDAVQEALARCSRHWAHVARADNPRAYVFRAVANEVRSLYRKRWHREVLALDEGRDAWDGASDARNIDDGVADFDELRRAMARLTLVQRTALVLRYYIGTPDEEAAEILGCSVNTVRSHIRRGLIRMRHELNTPGGQS